MDVMEYLTELHLYQSSRKTLKAMITMNPPTMALVDAMAGIIFPAIADWACMLKRVYQFKLLAFGTQDDMTAHRN